MNLRPHQEESVAKMAPLPGFFDMSDPGTGKTRVELADFAARRNKGGKRMLVAGPKSILATAWGDEIDKAFPGMTYSIASAKNRREAFLEGTDVVLTNHDAVTWIADNMPLLKTFDTLVLDESEAYKNPVGTQRTKAVRKIAEPFEWRRCLSGTPNPNTIIELWSQAFILDRGERLGPSYWAFRNVCCEPYQSGPGVNHIAWRDKPGIEQAIFSLLSDISIRHKYEATTPNSVHRIEYELPPRTRDIYTDMERHAIAIAGDVQLRAVHASAVATKLQQIASGAVYTGEDDNYTVIDTARTDLIMDLLAPRAHSLVTFNWNHQRDQFVKAATKRGYSFAVIDGSVDANERSTIVRAYQDGAYKALFLHPKTGSHGLTLTKGTTTIWSTPTWSSSFFKQLNARINRTGQELPTETILISAKRTVDNRIYDGLDKKLTAMGLLMSLMETV